MTVQNILLVDDSETELHVLTTALEGAGYRVRAARDGQQAIAALEEQRPDLVLMDVVMPGQNGFQLTRAISRDPRWQGLPIFICSSKKLESDQIWGMRQGAQAYFVKPVDKVKLLEKIKSIGGAAEPVAATPGAA